ncbi:MAG: molybdopterin molybdotransferase MoeA [Desulfovibrio sp.]|uniref:molybdopterin molybdotransferase MoeA n=1 Tax=Desulfovibrio sp. TaxID=885 RepID=UPI002589E243|nr:gephyrin-like molybdotransferase Glp [Desulfovibrio sp.]MCD7983176.1 molybdopterin molybdotransferase MoeA [Desulfovibrio sp.]
MLQDFFVVLSVAEVTRRLETFAPLPAETAALEDPRGLEGRVLAADVTARDDVPLTNRSGMDGYAVQAADVFGASEGNPVYLTRVGRIAVDRPADFSLEPGQCAAIVTGATLPDGADAVVMVEHTLELAAGQADAGPVAGQGETLVEIRRPVAPGAHVLRRGDDARRGCPARRAGTPRRPQEHGRLPACGAPTGPVRARPRVGILSTGDEVIPVSADPRPGQVRDVNSHALAAICREAGAEPRLLGIVPDDLEAIAAALRKHLAQVDVLLLSGGSSVGARDFTIAALERLPGAEIFCHGVALSPGKPLILARVGDKCVWGLPGQVASAQVVMFVLGAPFLRHLAGRANAFDQRLRPARKAVLSRNMASKQGREDYLRVRLEAPATDRGLPLAVPVPGLSGLLRTLLDAQGLVRIDANLEGLEEGSMVDVLLL